VRLHVFVGAGSAAPPSGLFFYSSHLAHAGGGLHADTAVASKVGQHLEHAEPVAVAAQGGVGDLADAADAECAVLLFEGAALQPVAADGHHLLAKAAHVGAECHRAEGVPAFDQAAKDEIGHGHGDGQTGRFEGRGAGKFKGHVAGELARPEQLASGQLLVGGDATPGMAGGVAEHFSQAEGVAMQHPLGRRGFAECALERLGDRGREAGDAHLVGVPGPYGDIFAVAGGAPQPRTGERFGAVGLVDRGGECRVHLAEVFERLGIVGAAQVGRQHPVLLGNQGQDESDEHRQITWLVLAAV
jgi:hypothetical protein